MCQKTGFLTSGGFCVRTEQGAVQQILEGRQTYTEFWTDRRSGEDRLEDLSINEMLILKWIRSKYSKRAWHRFIRLRRGGT